MPHNPYFIHPAMIVDKKQESTDIVTFRLQLTNPAHQESFRFEAGQFNMLYVFGVGEVAISIVSDPGEPEFLDHTIRVVGRITQVLGAMQPGESVGVRGPFGIGWPMKEAQGKDVVIVTGG
ncbi:MAG TPA: Ni/Fe hydrogenase subunit gamma, partial [Nitrospiraceae bacterium]|nr:Ni/Fe hydrogenase subunit gamma [Nitrospiraceae bacterium]